MATRLLIADNSPTVRALLAEGLTRHGFQVVGAAADGVEAVELCATQRPDVVALDFVMPRLDALGVLPELRRRGLAIPVVIVSSVAPEESEQAIRLLQEGAVEVVPKPRPGAPFEEFLTNLAGRLHEAVGARVDLLWADRKDRSSTAVGEGARSADASPRIETARRKVVVIAASTGGPHALQEVVPCCQDRIGQGMLIVQHMPASFTPAMARRLDSATSLQVREAVDGDRVRTDTALVAPGGRHLRLDDAGRVRLSDDAPVKGLRPRADLTILDAAARFGKQVVLVVLTGMGSDGLEGAREVKKRGGYVIAESKETAVVYGMPRAIVEAGIADEVLPLSRIAEAVRREAG